MLTEVVLLAISIGLIAFAFHKWATLEYDYFTKRNLPFKKPTFLLGSSGGFFLNKYSATEFPQMIYNWFPTQKLFGMFDFQRPQIVVRDPELVKQLAVKVFDYFEDHRPFIDLSVDELFGNSLFLMKGQRWRDMRATLSPAFTGSKMRQMFHLVTECADDMTKYYLKEAAAGKTIEVEMKNVFARYTNDVIASCAFGIRVNSFEEPKNEFYDTAKIFLGFSGRIASLILLVMRTIPFILKKFKIQLFPTVVRQFFTTMVIETMDERKKLGIFRPDMINILMQVRQGKVIEDVALDKADSAGYATVEESDIGRKAPQRQWTDKEIIAQCFLFFLAGFDTTSTMLTFLTYELCVNPDIQQKLREEIIETHENLGGKRISYETLQKMKYLDQVVSESLRKWPPVGIIDRLCVKDYLCEYGDGAKFLIEKGVALWIPIYGLHHDPSYFPKPDQFDPERFSDDNRSDIVPGSYLPFGIGPRNCIGSRFALMEVKAIIYHILLNFSLEPNAQSQIPLQLKKYPFNMQTERGVHMDFKLVKQHNL